ncbi:substance-P receptor-like [Lytechinus variegatus]|uniref:substance-P receptor-like n=1 Tax=Lytechinus variegatus TaxID=7654 RepID=UPI001BB25B28|nr:substance-P receptor-like [Lytechinus variegatus]
MEGTETTDSPRLEPVRQAADAMESFLDRGFQNSTFSFETDNFSSPNCFEAPEACGWTYFGHYRDFTQLASVYIIFIVIFVVIMALGIAGNSMVIGVVWSNRAMRTPTNYYIVSLAVSDLLVITFDMPLKLVEYTADVDLAMFSTGLCSFAAFVNPAVVFTSIWTLVAISIDRYLVIIHPLKARSFNTRSRALRTIVIIWLAPLVILSPYFYPYEVLRYHFQSEMGLIRRGICSDRFFDISPAFSKAYNLFLFGVLFLVPVILLGFTCGSISKRLMSLNEDEKMLKNSVRKEDASRRKVAKMVLIVVLCFFICWFPFFLVSMLGQFTTILHEENYIFTLLLVHLFGFANSFMNPVIYALMSQAFRSGFWLILTICCPQYRDLVAPTNRSGERRSVIAVSQTEVATERQQAKRGYNRFFRRESTQFSAVSDQDEDRIGMTKIGKVGNSSNNNNRRVANNQTVQEAERKQRAERLLHKFLDEEPPRKLTDIESVIENTNGIGQPTEPNECETPLIGNDYQEDSCKLNGPHVVYRKCVANPVDITANDASSRKANEEVAGKDGQVYVNTDIDKNIEDLVSEDELMKFNASVSKCAAWKATNDSTLQNDVILMINEDVPDAEQSTKGNNEGQNPSTPGVEQLMDCEHETTWNIAQGSNGLIPDEATTKV